MELPLSLSIATAEKMTVKLLERGTPLPASKTRIFSTDKPIPSAIMVELLAGERLAAADNRRLVRIRLGGLKKTVGGVARIAVKLEVTQDGDITLEAFDFGSHHKKKTFISKDWIPTEPEIFAAVTKAEDTADEEGQIRSKARLLSLAGAAVLTVKSADKADRDVLGEEQWIELQELSKDLQRRIRRAKAEDLDEADVKTISDETERINTILQRV